MLCILRGMGAENAGVEISARCFVPRIRDFHSRIFGAHPSQYNLSKGPDDQNSDSQDRRTCNAQVSRLTKLSGSKQTAQKRIARKQADGKRDALKRS